MEIIHASHLKKSMPKIESKYVSGAYVIQPEIYQCPKCSKALDLIHMQDEKCKCGLKFQLRGAAVAIYE